MKYVHSFDNNWTDVYLYVKSCICCNVTAVVSRVCWFLMLLATLLVLWGHTFDRITL